MKLKNFCLNLSTFFSLEDKKIGIEKAYTEGIYADTPANRKLGRVGMSYAEWERKNEKQNKNEKIDNISVYRLGKVLSSEYIEPMSIKDYKDYFLISLEKEDFEDDDKRNKVKSILEKLGAKVYVSQTTHFLKAFKKEKSIPKIEQDFFKIGDLGFDVNAEVLIDKDGNKKELTHKEAELLSLFASNPNKILSREEILEKVWGNSDYYNSRSMDVYITRLREKLSGDKNIDLKTIHWKGFKLYVPENTNKETSSDLKEEKESKREILTKIDKHFGFEDENAKWFADTPIALIMSNDKEFKEIIDNFTDYKVKSQEGTYENNGTRENMLKCNVSYKIVPKDTVGKGTKSVKSLTINNKTTINSVLNELVSIS